MRGNSQTHNRHSFTLWGREGKRKPLKTGHGERKRPRQRSSAVGWQQQNEEEKEEGLGNQKRGEGAGPRELHVIKRDSRSKLEKNLRWQK